VNRNLSLAAHALLIVLAFPALVSAQSPPLQVEGALGKAWFADDGAIEHTIGSGSVRWALTPRLSIGPELSYMVGPGHDRDLTLTGNVHYAFRKSGIAPFIVGGAGFFSHSDVFISGRYSSTEGGFTAGGGVRFPVGGGWYVAPEARVGWEPHTRLQVTVGYATK